MRHGEATFGRHGVKTGRQFTGETYREVSVLTDVHLRQIVDGLARFFLEPLDRLRLRHHCPPLSRSIACVMAIAMSTAATCVAIQRRRSDVAKATMPRRRRANHQPRKPSRASKTTAQPTPNLVQKMLLNEKSLLPQRPESCTADSNDS